MLHSLLGVPGEEDVMPPGDHLAVRRNRLKLEVVSSNIFPWGHSSFLKNPQGLSIYQITHHQFYLYLSPAPFHLSPQYCKASSEG